MFFPGIKFDKKKVVQCIILNSQFFFSGSSNYLKIMKDWGEKTQVFS